MSLLPLAVMLAFPFGVPTGFAGSRRPAAPLSPRLWRHGAANQSARMHRRFGVRGAADSVSAIEVEIEPGPLRADGDLERGCRGGAVAVGDRPPGKTG